VASLSEVPVSPVGLDRFRPILGDGYSLIEQAIGRAHEILAGRVVWHINSTARGGGVAEMLQTLLTYARGAGVDVRWMTIGGNEEFFHVTKRIHNNLHGSRGDGGELGDAERKIYEDALADEAAELAQLVQPGDIVYLHDPQPAGMVAAARERGAACVWRCHVGTDVPNELSRRAWAFLTPYVAEADALVFSRREFAWDGLDPDRLWIVAPSIDAFSAKNQEMEPDVVRAILATIGLGPTHDSAMPVFERQDGTPDRVDRRAEIDQDSVIPPKAALVSQVSRWDRLKDPLGVLECFAAHVRNPDAHLLLAGPAVADVADDPEGAEVLGEVRTARARIPEALRARTHLVCLPMTDVEENAAMVNAIQRRSQVVLQKSLAEGFGLTVAEAMWKSRPVVATRVGGIQDQIVDGESGVLVADPTDLEAVAAAIDGLLADPERAEAMGVAARERVREDFLGTRHLVQYMTLIDRMINKQAAAPAA